MGVERCNELNSLYPVIKEIAEMPGSLGIGKCIAIIFLVRCSSYLRNS
jgi:hypothetical protein